jgi:xanthine/CO dehydrogenase XdhC/CoxF family maturation factor
MSKLTATDAYLDDILPLAEQWLAEGRRVAIATVTETWGSAPRPAGSQLLIDQDGAMAGSVSGGCIEGAVVHEALRTLADGEPRLLSFGVSNEMAWEVGLACGGTVKVYVEPVTG